MSNEVCRIKTFPNKSDNPADESPSPHVGGNSQDLRVTPLLNIVKEMGKFLPFGENNPPFNNILDLKLLSRSESNLGGYSQDLRLTPRNPLTALCSLCKSEKLLLTAIYFAQYGAGSPLILGKRLGLPESTLYRFLNKLEDLGLIKPYSSIRVVDEKGGKPYTTIYTTIDATEEQIAKAIILHKKMKSKKYLFAEKMAQLLLKDFLPDKDEVTYKEIIVKIKEYKIPYRANDVAEMVCQILSEQGLKIWR